MILQDLHLTPQRQAHVYASGLLAIITLGTLALVVILLAALWLAAQIALFFLTSLVGSMNELASTFAGADPFVKLLSLCAIGLILYQIGRKFWRSAQ